MSPTEWWQQYQLTYAQVLSEAIERGKRRRRKRIQNRVIGLSLGLVFAGSLIAVILLR